MSQHLGGGEQMYISPPQKSASSEGWTLKFSRSLNEADGSVMGIAAVEVDAGFFVSGYEPEKLGEQGLLGIVGADGTFLVSRVGEVVSTSNSMDYDVVAPMENLDETTVSEVSMLGDNVVRYMGARQLYEFPVTVVAGVSKVEQLAIVSEHERTNLARAFAGNLILLLIIGFLWRMSAKLAESRRQATEERVAHAERVEYLAFHDSLTGLPNRSLFSKLLDQSINLAQRHRWKLAVLFLDLDRFKHINDTLGHASGDELLQEVAKRLTECLRKSDVVARLGGDEFVVMLPELSEEGYIGVVARKMISAIASPFTLAGQEFRITASIGVSTYPQDGLDEQTLTKNADVAMYHAKAQGRNNFQLYSNELHAESLQRLTLETSLQHALEREEFQLYYQAKRDVISDQITGMEALLRWQHPDLGTVAPMQFIPLAEETGLMSHIGKWVLKTACEQNVAWQKEGLPKMIMAVNLTGQQFFDPDLVEDITSILQQAGMDAGLLELEINEGLLMRDMPRTVKVLNQLKDIGVRIAIDDFGVGYSSLSMLKQFPLDTIKIDRTFIRDLIEVDEHKELTDAIVAMGRTLSLTVVAQGVETSDQADYLRNHACNELQGFYFNKPAPAKEFTALLKAAIDQKTP